MTRTALIVAHGQPSDPAPAEHDMAALAAAVARLLPGIRIGSATLANPGALEAAARDLGQPFIFPFFLSDGYFIRTVIPKRLAAIGLSDLPILLPFGLLPASRDLALRIVGAACRDRGWDEAATTLVLAAHGSGGSRASAEAAMATAAYLRTASGLGAIRCGFIEEPPHIAAVLSTAGPQSLCLPLFAARWGHVETDLPEAVCSSGYRGVMLDPIGTHPDVPALIAQAIRSA